MNNNIPTSVPLDVFFPVLIASFPEAPIGLLDDCVRRAIIKFCNTTHIIRRTLKVPLYCGEYDYILPTEDCLRVGYVYGISHYEGGPFNLPSMRGYTIIQPNQLQVKYYVDSDCDIYVAVSLVPKQDACEVPEVIYELYQDTIIAGATAYLTKMPNKKWTDYGAYQLYRQEFEAGMASANVDRLLNYKLGPHKLTLGFRP